MLHLCRWLGRSLFGVLVAAVATVAQAQSTFVIPPDSLPPTLAAGDVVRLAPGGSLPDSFSVPGGVTLDIVGGTAGLNLNITGDGTLRLFEGQVGNSANLFGTARVAGGMLGQSFDAESGAQMVITGGTVGFGYRGRAGSHTAIAGGDIGFGLQAESQATVHLFGTGFTLDGVSIPGLEESGDTVTVDQRGGQLLAGTLADGSAVDLQLAASGFERIDPEATVRLTLHQPGDFDHDGLVDLEDYEEFRRQFGTARAMVGTGADHSFSGVVDLADYTVWRDRLGSSLPAAGSATANAVSVPEPSSLMLAMTLLVVAWRGRGLLLDHVPHGVSAGDHR